MRGWRSCCSCKRTSNELARNLRSQIYRPQNTSYTECNYTATHISVEPPYLTVPYRSHPECNEDIQHGTRLPNQRPYHHTPHALSAKISLRGRTQVPPTLSSRMISRDIDVGGKVGLESLMFGELWMCCLCLRLSTDIFSMCELTHHSKCKCIALLFHGIIIFVVRTRFFIIFVTVFLRCSALYA